MVLFPGGTVPLRIFESRYLDMVSKCLREDAGFGVCLIKTGSEAGQPAEPVSIGTYARIINWQKNPDGLLGITIEGQQRFQLRTTRIQANNLIYGEIDWIEHESPVAVPAKFQLLQDLISRHLGQYGYPEADGLNDAIWLGYRIAELMPCNLKEKQQLLELTDPVARLDCYLKWFNQSEMQVKTDPQTSR